LRGAEQAERSGGGKALLGHGKTPFSCGRSRSAAATAAEGWARLESTAQRLHEPAVHGHATGGGSRIETGLKAFRETERDPRGERFVGRLGGRGVGVVDVDELQVLADDADLDASSLELGGELERGLDERLLKASGERRLERQR